MLISRDVMFKDDHMYMSDKGENENKSELDKGQYEQVELVYIAKRVRSSSRKF